MAAKFDPSNVTSKIDFNAPIKTENVRGLNVLITGGANGLGAAMTRRLCAEGAQVTIADFQPEAGEKIVEELRADGHKATFVNTNVTDWQSQVNAFKTAVKQSPDHRLDVVIPCAGTAGEPLPLQEKVSLEEDPPEPSTRTVDVTLIGVFYSTVLALHYFRLPNTSTNRKRSIIFIGSLAGYLEVPPVASYNISKFGVRGLWKSIRGEVGPLNVRTNLIAPTFMPTIAVQQVVSALEEKGARLGKIEDVADTALRLASDDSIDARAVCCGGNGVFDLRDDYEGLDAGLEVLEYFKTGAFGAGMHGFKEVMGGRTW